MTSDTEIPKITYDSLLSEANEVKNRLNDIQTSVYVVYPFDNKNYYHPELNVPNFYFLSYFDMDSMDMKFTITDLHMDELRALQEIPDDVLVGYCVFVQTIKKWQDDKDQPFPYHDHTGKLPDQYVSELKKQLKEDTQFNGDEGKLV